MPLYFVGAPDVRITVFDWSFQDVLALDASRIAKKVTYRNTQAGCDTATITLSCLAEDFERKFPWWNGRNGVEISTADDVTQISSAADATQIYVNDLRPYRNSNGEDEPQIALFDGFQLVMRIPVVGMGTDQTGNYLTLGAPLPGGGNPGALPDFLAGTVIYRRVYAGRIMRRDKQYTSVPNQEISIIGIANTTNDVSGSATISAAGDGTRMDVSTCIYNVLSSEAGRFPELTIDPRYFPPCGAGYAGSYQSQQFSAIIADMLTAINTGDQWVFRIGADRVARMVKTFDENAPDYLGVSTKYPYTVTFDSRALFWVPRDFKISDEDMSSFANSVEWLGDTDPTTKQPFSAIVQDADSIGRWGQVDATPQSNSALESWDQASQAGEAFVKRFAAPVSVGSFTFHTSNEPNERAARFSPIGIPHGNPLSGLQNVVVRNSSATGAVVNEVPDSEMLWASMAGGPGSQATLTQQIGGIVVSPPTLAYWNDPSGSFVIEPTDTGYAAVYYNHSGAPAAAAYAYVRGELINVKAGEVLTISGRADASAVTAGAIIWGVYSPDMTIQYGAVLITPGSGSDSRYTWSFQMPADFALDQVVVGCDMNNATVAAGGRVSFWQPQLERSSEASFYVANDASPTFYGLPSYVEETITAGGNRDTSLQFQAVEPDFNIEVQRQIQQVVSAIRLALPVPAYLDQYCVTAEAYTSNPIPFPVNGLVCTPGFFYALFARGTPIVQVGATPFVLPANAVRRVWLQPDNTWILRADTSPVPGAILYCIAQTDATTVIGVIKTASVGLTAVGVAYANVGNQPTPTFSAPANIANFPTATPFSSDVRMTVHLNNVPTDGSTAEIVFLYRQYHTGGAVGDWVPYESVDLAGMPNPPATQDVTFTMGQLLNGTDYDFGVVYAGLVTHGGAPAVINGASPWHTQNILVTTQYLVNTTTTPTLQAPPVLLESASTLISSEVTASFVIGNQPTDGSAAKVILYYRISGTTLWSSYGTAPIVGNAQYTVKFTDLSNGLTYEFGIALESLAGYETDVVSLGSIPVTILNVGTGNGNLNLSDLQMPSAQKTSGPHVTAATATGSRMGSGMALVDYVFNVSDFAAPPEWYAEARLHVRLSGSSAPLGLPTPIPASAWNVGGWNISGSVAVASGNTFDVGLGFVDVTGVESTIVWPITSAAAAGIGTPFILGGTAAPDPTVDSVAITNGTSVNGIAAVVRVQFRITDQPTDGSLAAIAVYFARAGYTDWVYYSSIPAVGVGQIGVAIGSYDVWLDDLTNGQTYEFGCRFESANGAMSASVVFIGAMGSPADTVNAPGGTITGNIPYTGNAPPVQNVVNSAGGIGTGAFLTASGAHPSTTNDFSNVNVGIALGPGTWWVRCDWNFYGTNEASQVNATGSVSNVASSFDNAAGQASSLNAACTCIAAGNQTVEFGLELTYGGAGTAFVTAGVWSIEAFRQG